MILIFVVSITCPLLYFESHLKPSPKIECRLSIFFLLLRHCSLDLLSSSFPPLVFFLLFQSTSGQDYYLTSTDHSWMIFCIFFFVFGVFFEDYNLNR